MGIELSFASSAGPPETTTASRAQRVDETAVSEWTSILGFLFQIEQPAEESPEPPVDSDPQSFTGTFVPTDGNQFWAAFLAKVPTIISGEAPVPSGSTETESFVLGGITDDTAIPEQNHEEGDGFELSTCDWTILSSPMPVPLLHASPLSGSSGAVSFDDNAPTTLEQPPQSHVPQGPNPAGLPEGPTTVEAVFQMQNPASEPAKRNVPNPGTREGTWAAIGPEQPEGQQMEPGQQRTKAFGDPKQGRNRSLSVETEDQGRHGAPGGDGGDSPPRQEESAPPTEQMNLADRGLLSVPSHSYVRANASREAEGAFSPETLRQAIDESMNISIPDKRASPLQFHLRISPDDFGTPNTGSGSDVRLNLIQRGDEILIKIQGGGEPLAIRAQSEWEGLVERLKPHGLEATSRALSGEFGRREGEPWTPSVPEQAMPDSAAHPGEEQRRFGQEQQQQHQQRQQRQRFSTRFGGDKTPFSLDYNPSNQQ